MTNDEWRDALEEKILEAYTAIQDLQDHLKEQKDDTLICVAEGRIDSAMDDVTAAADLLDIDLSEDEDEDEDQGSEPETRVE